MVKKKKCRIRKRNRDLIFYTFNWGESLEYSTIILKNLCSKPIWRKKAIYDKFKIIQHSSEMRITE